MKNETTDYVADKTQWHPGFYCAIELEFRADVDFLVFDKEHLVNSKPVQMDLLVIKKKSDYVTDNADALLHVSYQANQQVYQESKVEVDKTMYEGLQLLFASEINEKIEKAKESGWNDGRVSGWNDGRASGWNDGIRENQTEVAKTMLIDGQLPLETIARYSGLTLDEVERLQEDILQTV